MKTVSTALIHKEGGKSRDLWMKQHTELKSAGVHTSISSISGTLTNLMTPWMKIYHRENARTEIHAGDERRFQWVRHAGNVCCGERDPRRRISGTLVHDS